MYICAYLKLPTPLGQIYLMNGHYLYQIYLHSSSSGYLSEVSSLKLSKDKKKSISTSQSKMITACIGVFLFPQRNMYCSMIFPKAIVILKKKIKRF